MKVGQFVAYYKHRKSVWRYCTIKKIMKECISGDWRNVSDDSELNNDALLSKDEIEIFADSLEELKEKVILEAI